MGNALNTLVFQPPPPTYDNDPNLVLLHTERGNQIPAFFFNRGAPLTILFSHGNAEDLGMIVNYFRQVSRTWNVNFFAYEYSGYGRSSGSPSEANVYADAEAAFTYLTVDLKVKPEDVVLYGRSLGSGPTCHLATKFPTRGVILQSGILSIHRIALHLRFTLPSDIFCNIDKIKKIKCPVFVIHGTNDEVSHVTHGMELYNAAPSRVTPFWVEGGTHNNLEVTAGVAFFENVRRFLTFLEARDPSTQNIDYQLATSSRSGSICRAGFFRGIQQSLFKNSEDATTTRMSSPKPSVDGSYTSDHAATIDPAEVAIQAGV